MEILIQWAVFLFLLSILVLSHEFGHFIAARIHGITVEKFAFGFGPPLLRCRRKETDLLICAVPLGGYVKMAGDTRSDITHAPEEFYSKSVGARASVVFFGPLFNFFLALIIFWVLFMTGYPLAQPVVGGVVAYQPVLLEEITAGQRKCLEESGAAEAAGRYLYWNVGSEKELIEKISGCAAENTDGLISLLRRNQYPAYSAGVSEGDRITEVNGEKVTTWESAARLIRESGESTVLTLYRDNERRHIKIIPARRVVKDFYWTWRPPFLRTGEKEIAYIGIEPFYEQCRVNPFTALVRSVRKIGGIISLLFKGILLTIIGTVPFKEAFAGPVGIFKIGGEVAKMGVTPFFDFIGMLSVSLAVINLFPVPVLDGGHLFFMALEKVRGRPLTEKWENIYTNIGLALLLVLMVFILYNDFMRFILHR